MITKEMEVRGSIEWEGLNVQKRVDKSTISVRWKVPCSFHVKERTRFVEGESEWV
jgi:hypothetical protein